MVDEKSRKVGGLIFMPTAWKAQIAKNDYSIQFDTDNKDLYKLVEKACQKAVDKADKNKTEKKIGF